MKFEDSLHKQIAELKKIKNISKCVMENRLGFINVSVQAYNSSFSFFSDKLFIVSLNIDLSAERVHIIALSDLFMPINENELNLLEKIYQYRVKIIKKPVLMGSQYGFKVSLSAKYIM